MTNNTLAEWLWNRFLIMGTGIEQKWSDLPEEAKQYWEHEAEAVRRAVARGGFKNYQKDGGR